MAAGLSKIELLLPEKTILDRLVSNAHCPLGFLRCEGVSLTRPCPDVRRDPPADRALPLCETTQAHQMPGNNADFAHRHFCGHDPRLRGLP